MSNDGGNDDDRGGHRRGAAATVTDILYRGDRVRIEVQDWHSSFRGMRGVVVSVKDGRVMVHLDGDVGPVLFFQGEVKREE